MTADLPALLARLDELHRDFVACPTADLPEAQRHAIEATRRLTGTARNYLNQAFAPDNEEPR